MEKQTAFKEQWSLVFLVFSVLFSALRHYVIEVVIEFWKIKSNQINQINRSPFFYTLLHVVLKLSLGRMVNN